MYETFRDEMIYKLRGIDPVTLSTVISALDEVACGYMIGKSETALTVIGKDHFAEVVSIYIIVRKTEGLFNRTLEHVGRIMQHTMATQALRGGTGIELVQRMLGHSDISATMIYAEVDQSGVHSERLKNVI